MPSLIDEEAVHRGRRFDEEILRVLCVVLVGQQALYLLETHFSDHDTSWNVEDGEGPGAADWDPGATVWDPGAVVWGPGAVVCGRGAVFWVPRAAGYSQLYVHFLKQN